LTLKAVDAWTNTLVTNLMLVRGALTVTVTVFPSQLPRCYGCWARRRCGASARPAPARPGHR